MNYKITYLIDDETFEEESYTVGPALDEDHAIDLLIDANGGASMPGPIVGIEALQTTPRKAGK